MYTRVAVSGLLVNGLVSLVFAVLSVIDGEASTVWFFLMFLALSGAAAGLVWRFGNWALAGVGVGGVFK